MVWSRHVNDVCQYLEWRGSYWRKQPPSCFISKERASKHSKIFRNTFRRYILWAGIDQANSYWWHFNAMMSRQLVLFKCLLSNIRDISTNIRGAIKYIILSNIKHLSHVCLDHCVIHCKQRSAAQCCQLNDHSRVLSDIWNHIHRSTHNTPRWHH